MMEHDPSARPGAIGPLAEVAGGTEEGRLLRCRRALGGAGRRIRRAAGPAVRWALAGTTAFRRVIRGAGPKIPRAGRGAMLAILAGATVGAALGAAVAGMVSLSVGAASLWGGALTGA